MRRFEKLLRGLPAGFVFDGEIVYVLAMSEQHVKGK
jgi:hypothetical protein